MMKIYNIEIEVYENDKLFMKERTLVYSEDIYDAYTKAFVYKHNKLNSIVSNPCKKPLEKIIWRNNHSEAEIIYNYGLTGDYFHPEGRYTFRFKSIQLIELEQ